MGRGHTHLSSGASQVKEGEWFTSMSQALRLLSSITSKPRISKQDAPEPERIAKTVEQS